ncbi:MAG: hypothetical protein ACRBB3_01830 [Alphaproteobacteria bacterium]
MKSTSFTTPDKEEGEEKKNNNGKKEEKPKIEDIEEADLDESMDSVSDETKAKKSPEQKLWDEYKARKAKTASEKNNDDNEKTSNAKESDTDTESEAKVEKDEKKNTGLQKILEDYKNSQEGKGGLNSRSFGSID